MGFDFIPLAVETFGGWTELAESTLSHLATKLADKTDQPKNSCKLHLFQLLAVKLQRSNASMWLRRGRD
ncbi:MAG: hypothetical protein GY928_14415 [Colwellia sp.]|nr:hypothetical protein [Colwellia sp.]